MQYRWGLMHIASTIVMRIKNEKEAITDQYFNSVKLYLPLT
jgi:hypothetical protein